MLKSIIDNNYFAVMAKLIESPQISIKIVAGTQYFY